jgi:hypothetical protein
MTRSSRKRKSSSKSTKAAASTIAGTGVAHSRVSSLSSSSLLSSLSPDNDESKLPRSRNLKRPAHCDSDSDSGSDIDTDYVGDLLGSVVSSSSRMSDQVQPLLGWFGVAVVCLCVCIFSVVLCFVVDYWLKDPAVTKWLSPATSTFRPTIITVIGLIGLAVPVPLTVSRFIVLLLPLTVSRGNCHPLQ